MDDENLKNKENETEFVLSESERKMIYYVRRLKWGTVEILVQNGKPVLIKQMTKTIKLIDKQS